MKDSYPILFKKKIKKLYLLKFEFVILILILIFGIDEMDLLGSVRGLLWRAERLNLEENTNDKSHTSNNLNVSYYITLLGVTKFTIWNFPP